MYSFFGRRFSEFTKGVVYIFLIILFALAVLAVGKANAQTPNGPLVYPDEGAFFISPFIRYTK